MGCMASKEKNQKNKNEQNTSDQIKLLPPKRSKMPEEAYEKYK